MPCAYVQCPTFKHVERSTLNLKAMKLLKTTLKVEAPSYNRYKLTTWETTQLVLIGHNCRAKFGIH